MSAVFSRLNESVSYGNVDPLDYDAWDGYQASRNRTLATLYQHNIGNNIVISGDSHANWVSDLVWLDTHPYDPLTGKGSVGVGTLALSLHTLPELLMISSEFAGTAVSSQSP